MIAHGLLLSVVASVWLLAVLRFNPRLMIQDYPKDIQAAVPAKTADEKRMALILGLPLLVVMFGVPGWSALTLKHELGAAATFWPLALRAFGVAQTFNVVDWLVLDWLIFCTITPRFLVIPGTERMAGYKNYAFHFRGFLIGTVVSAVGSIIIATVI
ncbi:MAG: nitroreductase [Acidobacteriota bacterium]